MNFVIIRLQRYSGQPKATVNWGQPYIKEWLRSDFVQYKYTEASFRLSELKAVGIYVTSCAACITFRNFFKEMYQ